MATDTAIAKGVAVDTAKEYFVPYVQTRTVAPGVQVVVAALPAVGAVGDSTELRLALSIRNHGRIIYRDTTDDGWAYSHFAEPQTARLYPLWIPTGLGAGQLLIASNNRPSKDLVRRFFITNGRVVQLDTLPAFDGPARDLDHDGRLEYGGVYSYSEVGDDGHGHLGSTYDVALYYEVRPTGLRFDSVLTKAQAIKRFGGFYGYQPRVEFIPPNQPGARKAGDE